MSDYNTIKRTVAKFLRQVGGNEAASMVPEFIEMAEASIYRVVRIPPMENITDLTTDATDGFITLPADFLEAKAFTLIGDPNVNLKQRPYREVAATNRGTGRPIYFTRKDNQVIFNPMPDAQYTIRLYYYRQFDQLTAASPDNYFSNYAPDVLVYGALNEAAPWLAGKMPTESYVHLTSYWRSRFEQAVAELERLKDSEFKGSSLSRR